MWVKLNPGIKGANLVAYLLGQFVTFVSLGVFIGFVTFILEDPNYYNLDKSEIGKDLGYIGFWAEGVTVIQGLYMGLVVDAFGRKIPIVLCFLVTGACFIAVPMCRSLYPSYLIIRCLISMGTMVFINIPLVPDYVQKESMGLATAYSQFTITCAFLFSSTGLYSIDRSINDQKYIYFSVGAFIFLVDLVSIVFIKDIITQIEPNEAKDSIAIDLVKDVPIWSPVKTPPNDIGWSNVFSSDSPIT